jgi:hypothetical protein
MCYIRHFLSRFFFQIGVRYRDSSLQEIPPYLLYGGKKYPPSLHIRQSTVRHLRTGTVYVRTPNHMGKTTCTVSRSFFESQTASFIKRSSTPLLHSTSAVLVLVAVLARNLVLSLFSNQPVSASHRFHPKVVENNQEHHFVGKQLSLFVIILIKFFM